MSARKLLLEPLFFAVLALALKAAPVASQEAAAESVPTITARIAWQAGYFIQGIEDLDGAEPVWLGGDFAIGEPVSSIKPDVEWLARERPEVLRRLKGVRHIAVRAIVDKEGRVTHLRFEEDLEPDVRDLFLETLRAARFAPTVHFERGPVFVQVALDYLIGRGDMASSKDDGDEVGEVLRVMTDSEEGYPHEAPLKRYARILDKEDPPVLQKDRVDFLLSVLVIVGSSGVVEEARLFEGSREQRPPRATPAELRPLVPYLESFRFEPQYMNNGSPARFEAMVDLRLSDGRVEVASRATVNESDGDRLAEAYRLDEGRVLDLLLPPYPPERKLLIPSGPDQTIIHWEDDRPKYSHACFGCTGLKELILPSLNIPRQALRLNDALKEVRIKADVLMRPGATTDELLADLEDALREKLGLDLAFDLRTEMTPTLVLGGSIGEVPQDPESSGRPTLQVFTDRKNDDPPFGSDAGPYTESKDLVELLENQLGMLVVDQMDGRATKPYWIRLHRSSDKTRRFDLLIQNLEAQTDLDIRIEDQPTEVLYVTERGGT